MFKVINSKVLGPNGAQVDQQRVVLNIPLAGAEAETNISNEADVILASFAFDVWSFGAIMYSLLTGASLFQVTTEDNLVSEADQLLLASWTEETKAGKLAKVSSQLARDLLSRVFHKDPLRRLGMQQVLLHPFFSTAQSAPDYFDRSEANFLEY